MTEGRNKRTFKKNELILLAVLGMLFYFGIVGKLLLLPEYNKLKEAKIKLENTTVEYNHIAEQIKNIKVLQAEEAAVKKKLLKESEKIPPIIDRERMLLSMCAYSDSSNTTIESYNFSGINVYPFEGFALGSGASNAALDPNQVEADAEVMIVSSVDIRFKAYEDGLYKFLKAFESGEPSVYLKSCNIQSAEDTGELNGTIVMDYLAYKGKLAEYNVNLGLKQPKGRQTVFPSASQVLEEKQQSEMERIKKELEEMNKNMSASPASGGQTKGATTSGQ